MIWYRIIDSPLLPRAMATVSVLLVGIGLLFVGIHIGEQRSPEVAKRKLADAQRKIVKLTSALAQTELALEHARDVKRSMTASARDLEATIAKHLNRAVEAAQESVRHLLGCADQPTPAQRAKRRTA